MKRMSSFTFTSILLLALQLVSCAESKKESQEIRTVERPSGFFRSTHFSEEELKAQATNLWKTGKTISAAEAEKCYLQETHRPQIQIYCMLLWSVRSELNSNLSKILSERSTENSSWAIAAFLQKEAVINMDLPRLTQTLNLLQEQPLSLLVAALEERYLRDSSRATSESKEVMRTIKSIFLKNSDDLVPYLRITWILDRAEFQRILQNVCHLKTTGTSSWYCWKMLSFRPTDTIMLKELRAIFRSYFPFHWGDPNWKNFQSIFPKTAKNTRRVLEEK